VSGADAVLQMLTQQKTACDAMLDEKNKLITEYQAVCNSFFHIAYTVRLLSHVHIYAFIAVIL